MNPSPEILVGQSGKRVWIKVDSQGNFKNSPALKKAASSLMDRGENFFVIDLQNCPGMDSTFMGTLSGIALKLRRCGGELHVVRPGERNRNSLINLGLDAILEVHEESAGQEDDSPSVEPLESGEVSQEERTRVMLDAHQSLVEAFPDNYDQFQDVLEFLKKELAEGDSS